MAEGTLFAKTPAQPRFRDKYTGVLGSMLGGIVGILLAILGIPALIAAAAAFVAPIARLCAALGFTSVVPVPSWVEFFIFFVVAGVVEYRLYILWWRNNNVMQRILEYSQPWDAPIRVIYDYFETARRTHVWRPTSLVIGSALCIAVLCTIIPIFYFHRWWGLVPTFAYPALLATTFFGGRRRRH